MSDCRREVLSSAVLKTEELSTFCDWCGIFKKTRKKINVREDKWKCGFQPIFGERDLCGFFERKGLHEPFGCNQSHFRWKILFMTVILPRIVFFAFSQ